MELQLRILEGGLSEAKGFRANGTSCGLKNGGYKDLGVVFSESPCTAAGVFTRNAVKAAPVILDASRISNPVQAVIVNAGNANCLTGATGEQNALQMVTQTEKELALTEGAALVCSTGVIGKKLPMEQVQYGIEKVCRMVRAENSYQNFAHAIMTTDKKMKNVAYEFELDGKPVRIGATGKGAGMIKPSLGPLHATMLVFITTDAAVDKELLDKALQEAVEVSFNRISIDNDTSTNDTVLLLANGLAGNSLMASDSENYRIFKQVLIKVCQSIAKLLVKDGEGVTKIAQVVVKKALTSQDAEKIARSVADSYLVKTALFGQSPNWGRILAAMGYSGGKFELGQVKLSLNELVIFENGDVNKVNEGSASREMISPEITITIDLGLGRKEYFLWTSDLSCDYVKINANYLS